MKKLRPILAVSLLVQSLTFFVLSLLNIEKKKNLAKAFAAIGAVGGAAGAYLLVTEFKARKCCDCCSDDCDELDEFDDFDDLDVCEDDILCSFEDENGEKAEEKSENA